MEPETDVKWVNPVFDTSAPKLPYGHGFGPPESALDLSISGPSRGGDEKDLRLTFHIKAEIPSDASDAETEHEDRPEEEAPLEEEGCSRTLPRLPQRLQLKRQAQVKEEEVKDSLRKDYSSNKKVPPPVGIALARQRTNERESRPATPPAKPQPLNTPLTPQATPLGSSMGVSYSHPMGNVFFPPSAWPWPEPPLMQPAPAFPWHPVSDVLAMPGHPVRPFLSNLDQVNVTSAGISPSPYLLIPAAFLDPYQRAAAAVLWPGYAAAAAAATNPQGWPLQPEAPPHLPPIFPQTPLRYSATVPEPPVPAATPSLEELHRQKLLLSSSNSHEVKMENLEGKQLKSTMNRKKSAAVLSVHTPESLISPLSVNVDPVSVTPVSLSSPGADVPDSGKTANATEDQEAVANTVVKVESSAATTIHTTEKETPMELSVAVNDEDTGKLDVELTAAAAEKQLDVSLVEKEAKPPEDAVPFAGLQLLSDSIERFVSAAVQEPPTVENVVDTLAAESEKPASRDVALAGVASHPLDVLFAAALAAEPEQGTSTASIESGLTSDDSRAPACEACVEDDVRKKLTELQQQYKEKQKELKHLKVKKKDKKKKKDKNKEKRKDGEPHTRATSRTTSADFITPGRLHHVLSSTNQTTGNGEAVLPNIKTSYAAALASAASNQSTDPFSMPTSAAKKRKPDLPRKHDSECTETIVPKKRKLFQLLQWCRPQRQWNSDVDQDNFSVKPKVKPSLKAEVKLKPAESDTFSSDSEGDHDRLELHCLPALQYLQLSDEADPVDLNLSTTLPSSPAADSQVQPEIEVKQVSSSESEHELPSCALREELLEDGLRVLLAEDGLFQGGCVRNIRPPDIYGVAVDGERGSRPRILSTEEILHGTILEVKPTSISQIKPGTRICAYWSQHSRCLYPGTVSAIVPAGKTQSSKHASIEDQVDVEFDDGDTGRIPLSQIRFLPQDYPIIERDPNPVLPIESRRKRRGSGVITVSVTSTSVSIPTVMEVGIESQEPDSKKAKKKKHKKKHKKKSKYEDEEKPSTDLSLVIPVSPGPVVGTTSESEAFNESGYHSMEVNEEGSASALAPPPRRAAAAALAKSKQHQQQQQQLSPTGKSKSKMAAFLPERQLWKWLGPSFKKASKGKGRKEFYKAIHRGEEVIRVGDCAVFLSSGRPDRPYVGRIELLWQSWGGSMTVKVRWFYHPEETCGGRRLSQLKTPGALFESNHVDENDVQTISHSCLVLPLNEFRERRKPDENLNLDGCYDLFYLAGFYDPTSAHLSFEPGVFESSS